MIRSLFRSQTRRVALFVALALVAATATPSGQTKDVFDCATSTVDVALVTTAETVIISSNLVNTPRDEAQIMILAWAQLTTGTNTTGVTPKIRRGTLVGGTLVNEANVEQVKAAAGSTEQFSTVAFEQRAASSVQYSLTLTQAAASANGSALQATICVIAR